MQNVIPFEYEGRAIRIIPGGGGEPWWAAVDVCRVLGLDQVSRALSRLDDDEKTTLTISTCHIEQGLSDNAPGTSLNLVNEPGLYRLILTSRKPEAHAFKRWVTHEVLPTLRKTGKYETAPNAGQGKQKATRKTELKLMSMAAIHSTFKHLVKMQRDFCKDLQLPQALSAAAAVMRAEFGIEITRYIPGLATSLAPSDILPTQDPVVVIDSIQETDIRLSPDATLNASDLGALLGGYTGIAFNRLLYGLGYQVRHTIRGKAEWHPTEKGAPFAVKTFVPRTGGRGSDVPQLLWKAKVLDALRTVSISVEI